MEILHYLAGPIIGAVIGYCTNWIAVKMLFHPHKPVKIGKLQLPFTPGLIPKRQNDLARAVGHAIETTLLTKDDIHNTVAAKGAEAISDLMTCKIADLIGEQKEPITAKVEEIVTEKICQGIHNADVASIIANRGAAVLGGKISGSFIGSFINDNIISSLARSIGEQVDAYVDGEGYFYILSFVHDELEKLEENSVSGLLEAADIPENKQREIVENLIIKAIDKVLGNINIAAIVEDKISAMDVYTLEGLVMSVMKKELNAIVKVGGLIGLIIGILTVFF